MSESPRTQKALFAEGSQERESMLERIIEKGMIIQLDSSCPALLNASNSSGKEERREGDGKRKKQEEKMEVEEDRRKESELGRKDMGEGKDGLNTFQNNVHLYT